MVDGHANAGAHTEHVVALPSAYEPGWHAVGTPVRALDTKKPGSVDEHADAPASAYCPSAHATGRTRGSAQLNPAMHVSHAVAPAALYVPALHGTGACEATAAAWPAGETVQLAAAPKL